MRRGAHPCGFVDVLVGHGNAEQWPLAPGGDGALGGAGGGQRLALGHQQEGAELWVDRGDPGQQGARQLHW